MSSYLFFRCQNRTEKKKQKKKEKRNRIKKHFYIFKYDYYFLFLLPGCIKEIRVDPLSRDSIVYLKNNPIHVYKRHFFPTLSSINRNHSPTVDHQQQNKTGWKHHRRKIPIAFARLKCTSNIIYLLYIDIFTLINYFGEIELLALYSRISRHWYNSTDAIRSSI